MQGRPVVARGQAMLAPTLSIAKILVLIIILHLLQLHKKNFFHLGESCVIMASGDNMDRNNIEKIAHTPEDRLLLA